MLKSICLQKKKCPQRFFSVFTSIPAGEPVNGPIVVGGPKAGQPGSKRQMRFKIDRKRRAAEPSECQNAKGKKVEHSQFSEKFLTTDRAGPSKDSGHIEELRATQKMLNGE